MAGAIERGEVRLYRFPRPDKRRPVVVLTRTSAIGYLSTVTVAPIISTLRGVPSEVHLAEADGMKGECAVNLHNVVTVSKSHLGRRVVCPPSAQNECERFATRWASLCDVHNNPQMAQLLPNGPPTIARGHHNQFTDALKRVLTQNDSV